MSMRAVVQHINDLGFDARVIDGNQIVIKCDCYRASPGGARRVKFVAQSIGEAAVWATEHTHGYPTFESAMSECRRMAAERRRQAELQAQT